MVQPHSVLLVMITLTILLSSPALSEDIPYPEYNVEVVLQILGEAVRNTVDFHMHGGFPVEQVVSYHCRSPSHSDLLQVFKYDDHVQSKLDTAKKLMLIIHGYTDNRNRNWLRRMVRDVAQLADSNVCVVDWSKLATTEYTIAAGQVNKVGEEVGTFLLSTIAPHIPLGRVSILGHSLGAHVAGAAGAKTAGAIEAIYGIDPAHPLITIPMRPPSERLDPTDAQFVQVIHTTSGLFGTPFNIGHADWYADNGRNAQKGCEPGTIVFDKDALAPISLVCSHLRALEIFRFALDPVNQFRSTDGLDVYGYWSSRARGVFEFPTTRNRPYII